MTRQEFIDKSLKVHGNKYIYTEIPEKVNSRGDVTIICREHGPFVQNARSHYRGHGCPICKAENTKKALLLNTEKFLEKYRSKFKNEYDTSLVDYKDFETNVKMICPKHGIFELTPHSLMRGKGCPKCGNAKSGESRRLSRDEVISRARKIHGGKYSYEKYNGEKLSEETTIICPIHGEFKQTMRKHLMGSGCKKCGYEKLRNTQRKDVNHVIEQCKEIHNNKYIYILDFEYINNKSKLHAVCPVHGEFWQEINSHLQGEGCPECGKEETTRKLRKDKEYMINRAREVHGDKYSYDNFQYINWHTKGYVTCPIHGDFLVSPNNHIGNGSGCPKCINPISKWEQEVFDFISSLDIECEQSNRKILNGKEIDIFIPKYNIGIECDGLRWHNEQYKAKSYHLDKTNESEKYGVRLIHIFEDEWIFKKDIWQSMLRNIFGLIDKKIYARNCVVKDVSAQETRNFLDKNHIQGYSTSKFNYGLYYQDKLVSLMTFGIPRINMGGDKSDGNYELVRFCNKIDTNVVGGASKLFKHFIEEINPKEIVSYSDKRWSTGNLYSILGFEHIHDSRPNYYYVNNMRRMNRFGFRKDVLVKEGYDKDKTEHEIMLERGIYRIYDCGTKVWKWKS